jgi:hypothetical protein
MRLTNEQIIEFQGIYFETFGKQISKKDALEQGLALLKLVKTITKPQKDNEKENNNESTKLET